MKTIVLLIWLLFVSCSTHVADTGSGTNIGNAAVGIVVSSVGTPMEGVVVALIPPAFEGSIIDLPDSLKDTTDSDGYYQIPVSIKGAMLSAVSKDSSAAMDIPTFSEEQILTLAPRCSVTVNIKNAAKVMVGSLRIEGMLYKQPIELGDSLLLFTDVPPGVSAGLRWFPKDSSRSFVVYELFSTYPESNTILTIGGAGRWKSIPRELRYDTLRTMAVTQSGTVWLGSAEGSLFYSDLDSSSTWGSIESDQFSAVYTIAVANEQLWVVTDSGIFRGDRQGVEQFSTERFKGAVSGAAARDSILAIVSDSAVVIFRGAERSGIVGSYSSVAVTSDGTVFAGTPEKGVLEIGESGTRWITTSDGLPSDSIISIASEGSVTAVITSKGVTENRTGIWEGISSDVQVKSFRTVAITGETVWYGGTNSFGVSNPGFPFQIGTITDGYDSPRGDFFSSASGPRGGIYWGAVDGILQMP